MTTLAYSHTLVAGTPENINVVQDMFNDARTVINGNLDTGNMAATMKAATLTGFYRTVDEISLDLTSANTGATTYTASASGTADAIGTNTFPVVIPITLADYAVSGLTTQFRVQAATITNTVAPAVNFTFACQQIATLGGVAGSIKIASLVAAPATVTRSAPAASSGFVDSTADFTLTPGGVWVLTVASSGTPAANSNTMFRLRLQVHNI
jgi:hypothetical protein